MLHRQAHEADIEPAGDQGLDLAERGHVGDLDFNSGRAFPKLEQGAGNQAVHGGHAHAEPQLSRSPLVAPRTASKATSTSRMILRASL